MASARLLNQVADSDFIFGLPPSLGPKPSHELAKQFTKAFAGTPFATVRVIASYSDLESGLQSGAIHAAWCPPIVCARNESNGGQVVLRSVRYGSTTYRAVLLCRADSPIELKRLAEPGAEKLTAAWVDEWSMGGCILPRYYLRTRGLKLDRVLKHQMLLESYKACFDAVLDGKADLCSSYAGRRGLGYVDLCGESASKLKALAYTDASPNDGVAISAGLAPDRVAELKNSLKAVLQSDAARQLLSDSFDVDGFDEPPPGTYSALLSFLA